MANRYETIPDADGESSCNSPSFSDIERHERAGRRKQMKKVRVTALLPAREGSEGILLIDIVN